MNLIVLPDSLLVLILLYLEREKTSQWYTLSRVTKKWKLNRFAAFMKPCVSSSTLRNLHDWNALARLKIQDIGTKCDTNTNTIMKMLHVRECTLQILTPYPSQWFIPPRTECLRLVCGKLEDCKTIQLVNWPVTIHSLMLHEMNFEVVGFPYKVVHAVQQLRQLIIRHRFTSFFNREWLTYATRLRVLSLDSIHARPSLSSTLTKLTHLQLSGNIALESFAALTFYPRLHTLHITLDKLEYFDPGHLITLVALNKLQISNMSFTSSFFVCLSALTRLQELSVINCVNCGDLHDLVQNGTNLLTLGINRLHVYKTRVMTRMTCLFKIRELALFDCFPQSILAFESLLCLQKLTICWTRGTTLTQELKNNINILRTACPLMTITILQDVNLCTQPFFKDSFF